MKLRNRLKNRNSSEESGLQRECNWFDFKPNTPTTSHAGGVWEIMIPTVRSVLDGLLEKHGTQLDEESLRALHCEAECIVNSHPISRLSTQEDEPLTPNQLLSMKSRVLMPPPGEFQRNDVYLTKRWKRVQYLANCFWEQWTEVLFVVVTRKTKMEPDEKKRSRGRHCSVVRRYCCS